MWWTKIPDTDRIAMLDAAPLPWLPCHVRSWIFYAQRCCGEGRPYWYPDHATGRLGSMSQKCKAPGSAALAKMVGCSRKTAQRLIDSTKAPSRAKVQNGTIPPKQRQEQPHQNPLLMGMLANREKPL